MQKDTSFDQLAKLFQSYPPLPTTPSTSSLISVSSSTSAAAKEAIQRDFSGQLNIAQRNIESAFKSAIEAIEAQQEVSTAARYKDRVSRLATLEDACQKLSSELNTTTQERDRLRSVLDNIIVPHTIVLRRIMAAWKSMAGIDQRESRFARNAMIVRICKRNRLKRVIQGWNRIARDQARSRREQESQSMRETRLDQLQEEYSRRIDQLASENEMLKEMVDRGSRLQSAKEDEMRKSFLKSVSRLNFEAMAMFSKAHAPSAAGPTSPALVTSRAAPEPVTAPKPQSPVQQRNPLVYRHQY